MERTVTRGNLVMLDGTPIIRGIPVNLNLNADAQPERWDPALTLHVRQGVVNWDPRKARLFRASFQKQLTGIHGRTLLRAVCQQPAMNACALEFMRTHPYVIPDAWKQYSLFFWGTIYQERKNEQFVRYLWWNHDEWQEGDLLLDGYGWSSNSAAVCYRGLHPLANHGIR